MHTNEHAPSAVAPNTEPPCGGGGGGGGSSESRTPTIQSVPSMPDNSRRPKGTENPRNIAKKLWVDREEAQKFAELCEAFGSSESALIRWLIHLGLAQVNRIGVAELSGIAMGQGQAAAKSSGGKCPAVAEKRTA